MKKKESQYKIVYREGGGRSDAFYVLDKIFE